MTACGAPGARGFAFLTDPAPPPVRIRWPSYPFKYTLFMKLASRREQNMSQKSKLCHSVFHNHMNLHTVPLVSIIIRLVAVPVSITEVRMICRAVLNSMQLFVMSVAL